MNRMKVLFVSSYYGENEGGADISTRLLAEGLAAEELDVHIASINPAVKENIYPILNYAPLPTSLIAFLLNTSILDKTLTKKILQIIYRVKPDILHIHDIMLLPAAIKASKRAGIPCIITVRDLRFVTNIPILSMDDLASDFSSRMVFIKYLARQKGLIPALFAFPFVFSRAKALRRALRQADSIVAISNFVKKQLLAAGIAKKIEVIYNPVPKYNKINLSRLPEDEGKVLFFAPGRLEYYKGFQLLISAMKQLVDSGKKNCRLYIAGTGPEEKNLKRMALKYGLNESVVFLGKLSYDEIKKYYFMCDCVLFPSLWPEPLGRIPLEAMAAGKVCIATNVGGISELVEKQYLVEPEEFAESMAKIVSNAST